MELLLQPDNTYACQKRVRTDPFFFTAIFRKSSENTKYGCKLCDYGKVIKLGIEAVKKKITLVILISFNLESIFSFRKVKAGFPECFHKHLWKLKQLKASFLQFTSGTKNYDKTRVRLLLPSLGLSRINMAISDLKK